MRSRLNCETRSRRCVRIRTPRCRAASTKPAAAIVLPDAVGWRNRNRRTAPGSASASSVLDELVLDEAGVEVVVRLFVDLGLGTAPFADPFPLPFSSAGRCVAAMSSASMPASASTWWRRSSVPAAVRAGILGEHALEPEHEAVAHLPARGRLLRDRHRSRPARRRAPTRRAVPGASACSGSSSGCRNGSPNQDSARRAAAVRFSDVSDVSVGMVVASCIQAARLSVPLLPKSCRSRCDRRAVPVGAYLRDRAGVRGRATTPWRRSRRAVVRRLAPRRRSGRGAS